MTRDELHQEFMEDETQYCCYCGLKRGHKFGCCGENHWQTYAQMDASDQKEFLDWEEENERKK